MNQLNIFLLAFGALQGVLLALWMLRKRTYRTAYVFLLLYLLVLLMQVMMKLAAKIWLIERMPVVYFTSYDLPLLYGPLLYLFIRQMQNPQRSVRPADMLHFVPFLYFASGVFLIHLTGSPLAVRIFEFRQEYFFAGQLISLAAYHIISYGLLRHISEKQEATWLRRHVLFSAVLTFCIAIGIYLMYMYYPQYTQARFLFAFITVYVYWISYQAMQQPDRFQPAALRPVHSEFVHPASSVSLRLGGAVKKYSNSTLKSVEMESILEALHKVMEIRRPYLSPDLSIDALAAMVGTNRHNLSQVINERLHKNFYDYLNEYRVKAAETILADPDKGYLKIAAIAYDAGFNSLSTFNEVFKKRSGVTPSAFRSRACKGISTGPD